MDWLRKKIKKMRSDESGFTLVELLVVIIILGVLTGVTVFAVGSFSDRGELEACQTEKETVELAAKSMATDDNFNGWSTVTNYGDDILNDLQNGAGTDPYLDKAPSLIDQADSTANAATDPTSAQIDVTASASSGIC